MKRVCKFNRVLALGLVLLVATACASYGTVPAPTAISGGTAAPTAIAPTGATPQGGGASVDIRGFAFSPATLTVSKGTTVTWTNNDSVAHTVTATGPSSFSANIRPRDALILTFNMEETFNYRCSLHPSMVGTVEVK